MFDMSGGSALPSGESKGCYAESALQLHQVRYIDEWNVARHNCVPCF